MISIVICWRIQKDRYGLALIFATIARLTYNAPKNCRNVRLIHKPHQGCLGMILELDCSAAPFKIFAGILFNIGITSICKKIWAIENFSCMLGWEVRRYKLFRNRRNARKKLLSRLWTTDQLFGWAVRTIRNKKIYSRFSTSSKGRKTSLNLSGQAQSNCPLHLNPTPSPKK